MKMLLKDIISEDLSLRNMASSIFNKKEFQTEEEILIDFTGIKSMSRSFAHEYLENKTRQQADIMEINVASDIKKMFEIVQDTKAKPELIKNVKPLEINTLK